MSSVPSFSQRIFRLALSFVFSCMLFAGCFPLPAATTPVDHLANIERSRANHSIVVSKDTIYSSGLAYACLFDDEAFGFSGGIQIFPLEGNDRVHVANVIEHGHSYLQMVFHLRAFDDSACMAESADLQSVIPPLMKSGIVLPTIFDEQRVRLFCKENSCSPFESDSERMFKSRIVARDRRAPVSAMDGVIRQGSATIGTYSLKSIPNKKDPANPFTMAYVFFKDHSLCATITYGNNYTYMNGLLSVTTSKDRKERTVQKSHSDRAEQAFAEFLVRESYL